MYLTIGQLILSLFLSAGLKYLWNQIYIVQFIVFFIKWNINIPAKVLMLLEILKDLVFFEFVKKAISKIASDPACEDLENICKANQGVTSSIDRINNDGFFANAEVMIIGGVILGLAFIAVGVCFVLGKYSPKAKAIYMKIKGKVMWNSVIRYFFQSTLQLQVSAATGIYFHTVGFNAFSSSS